MNLRPFPTQTILWFWEFMNLFFFLYPDLIILCTETWGLIRWMFPVTNFLGLETKHWLRNLSSVFPHSIFHFPTFLLLHLCSIWDHFHKLLMKKQNEDLPLLVYSLITFLQGRKASVLQRGFFKNFAFSAFLLRARDFVFFFFFFVGMHTVVC